jgi:hypothetical protein
VDPRFNARTCLDGMNRLLERVEGGRVLISDILRSGGLDEAGIDEVRRHALEKYVIAVSSEWSGSVVGWLPPRHATIVVRRFSLDGLPQSTLHELATDYGVSRERVRQLEEKAIRRIKSGRRREVLKESAIAQAKLLVGVGQGPEIPVGT